MVRSKLLKEKIRLLSPLERQACGVMWCSCSPCNCAGKCGCGVKVRDVFDRLRKKGVRTTVSSVAVVLGRLHDLGLVKRRAAKGPGGVHYYYALRMSREEFESALLKRAVDNLAKAFGPAAKKRFAELFVKR